MVKHLFLSSALFLSSLAVVSLLSPSPPSSPTSPRRLPPLPPLLPLLSLSLLCAPPSPLTCRLPACLVASLRHPLARCLPLPPSSDFLSPHGSPPPLPPFSAPTSSGSASLSFIWSRGGCGCPASFWGYFFPGSLDCYACAAPSPDSAWPPSHPPSPFEPSPLGDTVDPLPLASSHGFQGVVPVPLAPWLLLWPWRLRTPPTVVFASACVHCFL